MPDIIELMNKAREATKRIVGLQTIAQSGILRVATDSREVMDRLLALARAESSVRRDYWGNYNSGEDTSTHSERGRFFVTTIIGSTSTE